MPAPPPPPVPPIVPAPVEGPFYYGIQQMAPPWMQDDDTIKYLFTVGAQVDTSQEYVRIGIVQRFPTFQDRDGNPYARPEAVAAQGRDRQISRGQYEPDASYRERVRVARTTWARAGNAQTLLRQIRAYYLPNPPLIRYVVNGRNPDGSTFADWSSISAGPESSGGGVITTVRSFNNWDWDGQVGKRRFWVIVYATLTPWKWGALPAGSGLSWGGGQSWGFIESSAWLRDVRNIIAQWKAAGSHAGVVTQALDAGIISAVNASCFDPAYPPGGVPGFPMPQGDWDDPSNRPDGANGNDFNGVFFSGV